MGNGDAQQLQHPAELDPRYITELIKTRLDLLQYRESRADYYLYTDLAILYNTSIRLMQRINTLVDGPLDDLDELAQAVSDIRVGLGPAMRHHIRTSAPSLHRLQVHIDSLEGKPKD